MGVLGEPEIQTVVAYRHEPSYGNGQQEVGTNRHRVLAEFQPPIGAGAVRAVTEDLGLTGTVMSPEGADATLVLITGTGSKVSYRPRGGSDADAKEIHERHPERDKTAQERVSKAVAVLSMLSDARGSGATNLNAVLEQLPAGVS